MLNASSSSYFDPLHIKHKIQQFDDLFKMNMGKLNALRKAAIVIKDQEKEKDAEFEKNIEDMRKQFIDELKAADDKEDIESKVSAKIEEARGKWSTYTKDKLLVDYMNADERKKTLDLAYFKNVEAVETRKRLMDELKRASRPQYLSSTNKDRNNLNVAIKNFANFSL